MLTKSKLSSIDILIFQASTDMNISHEEFIMILKEKDRYEMMKENLKIKMENLMKLLDLIAKNKKIKIIKYIKWKRIAQSVKKN